MAPLLRMQIARCADHRANRDAFAAVWAEDRAMSLDQVIAYALDEGN
jgi:hypothetical protein